MLHGSGRLAQFRPSIVGSEACAMRTREFLKTCDYRIDTALARVGQRTATERCKARAENDTRVDQIRIRDDPFAQHRGAFVGEREDEPVLQVRRWLCGWSRRLDRLAITPHVE